MNIKMPFTLTAFLLPPPYVDSGKVEEEEDSRACDRRMREVGRREAEGNPGPGVREQVESCGRAGLTQC